MAKLSINIGEKELYFKVNLFDGKEEIDVDKILKIDIQNLTAEILTFPVILNRLGIILADKENEKKETELNYKIWRAKEAERIRTKWDSDKTKVAKRGQKYTKDEVDDYVVSTPVYKIKKQKLLRLEKECAYVSSVYWAAKDKADKLEKLSLTLTSEDINLENVAKVFNGILIKASKPLIE